LGVALPLKAIQRGSLTLGVLAGLAWLGQASIHPQMPVLMGGATALALCLRPASPRGWVAAAVAFAIPAPYILYSYLAFVGNPEVERWTFHSKNAVAPETISLLLALAPQLLLAAIGSAFLVLAPIAVAGQPQYVISAAEFDGLNWLAAQPTGRVLCMPGVGLYVPAYSSDTVYVGHYDETFDYANKTRTAFAVLTGQADIEQF